MSILKRRAAPRFRSTNGAIRYISKTSNTRAPLICGAFSHSTILEPLTNLFKASVLSREARATRVKVAQTAQTKPPPSEGGAHHQIEDPPGTQAAAGDVDAAHDNRGPLWESRFAEPQALSRGPGSRDFENLHNVNYLHHQTAAENATSINQLLLLSDASAKSTASPPRDGHNHVNGSSAQAGDNLLSPFIIVVESELSIQTADRAVAPDNLLSVVDAGLPSTLHLQQQHETSPQPCCLDPEKEGHHNPKKPIMGGSRPDAASPPFAAAREALQQHLRNHRTLRTARRNSLCDSVSDVSAVVEGDHAAGWRLNNVRGDTADTCAESVGGGSGHTCGPFLGLVKNSGNKSLLPHSSRPPRPIGQSFRALLQPDGGAYGGTVVAAEAVGGSNAGMQAAEAGVNKPMIQVLAGRTAALAPGQEEQHQEQSTSSASATPSLLPFASRHPQFHRQEPGQQPYFQHLLPPASVLPRPPQVIPSSTRRERAPQQAIPAQSIGSEADSGNFGDRRQQVGRVGSPWRPFSPLLLHVPRPATSILGTVLRHLAARKPPPLRAAPRQQLNSGGSTENKKIASGGEGADSEGGERAAGGQGQDMSAPVATAMVSGGEGGRIHTTDQAHEALAQMQATAEQQAKLAEQLEEWAEDHPVAHLLVQLQVLRIQLHLLQTQVALWRPVELLNGRLALLGLTAGLYQQATSPAPQPLFHQALHHPLSIPSAFALVALLTAVHRQLQPRMKTRGLLMSPRAHRWMGRAAMVGFIWAVLAEATDPAHRPMLQQLKEWMLGTVAVGGEATGPFHGHGQGQGPVTGGLADHGAGLLDWLWVWW